MGMFRGEGEGERNVAQRACAATCVRLLSWGSPSSFVRALTTVGAGKPSAEGFDRLPPRQLAASGRVLALLDDPAQICGSSLSLRGTVLLSQCARTSIPQNRGARKD